MPYKRLGTRRIRKRAPRRSYAKRPSRQLVATVRRVVHGMAEKKYNDNYAIPGVRVDYNGKLYCLSYNIAQGTQDIYRIGDKISIKSIQIQGDVQGTDLNTTWRMIVFQWKPVYAASAVGTVTVPAVSDILINTLGTNMAAHSLYSHDKRSQFRVLMNRVLKFNSATAEAMVGVQNYYNIRMYKKFKKDLVTQYVSAGVSAATGGIFVLLISNLATASVADAPVANLIFRTNFYDM